MGDAAFWQDTIQWAIFGVVMALVMGALARARLKARPPMEGNTLVQPKAILIVGLVCAGFFAVCAVLSFNAKTGGPAVASVFIAFALLGAVILLDYHRARHTLTSSGLEYGTLFKGRQRVNWGEVTSVRYSPAANRKRCRSSRTLRRATCRASGSSEPNVQTRA